jgi:mandelate racemase
VFSAFLRYYARRTWVSMPEQTALPPLVLRAIRPTPIEVPLNFVLSTSQGTLRQVPLLLVDVETEGGVTGRTWLFRYMRAVAPAIMSILGEAETVAKGAPVDPAAVRWRCLSGALR